MKPPAPKTSLDAALGNLLAAALDVPAPADPSEVPAWAPDNTLARTGNTEKEQTMWFAGMEQAQANAQDNAAIRSGVPVDVLEIARESGLRSFLHGVNAMEARIILQRFVDALPVGPAAGDAQNAARYRTWRDAMLAEDERFLRAMADTLPDAAGAWRRPNRC